MSGEQERFQKAMNAGHSAAWDQEWGRAVDFYRQALQEIPNQPTALTSLGLALYQLQNYREALVCYQRAAELCPDDPLPLEKVGEIQELSGSLNSAVDTFMQVAEIYARTRDISKAVDTWIKVTRINQGHFLSHSRLALVYERMGRKQQAAEELLAMASLLQHAGEVQKAVQAAVHAQQLAPESPEPADALALLRTGQPLPKLSRPGGDTGPLIKAQLRSMSTKELKEAKESPNPIKEARQKALTELAGLIFEGSEEEAPEESSAKRGVQAIVQGLGLGGNKLDRTRLMLHLTQAVDMQSRDKSAGAMEELDRALDAGLDHPAAYFNLGLLALEAGLQESAVRHLAKAVNHTDYALGARLLAGQAYQKLGKNLEAATEYMEALRLADSAVVAPELAEELRQMYEPMIEALSGQPEDSYARICNNVSDLLLHEGWREKLSRARQQLPVPGIGEPPVPLAELLSESGGGKLVEAITRIHQLTKIGQYRAAMEEAYFALQYAPTYMPLHTLIGDLLLQQNYTTYAMQKLNIVARAYAVRGHPRRAVDIYHKIIDLNTVDMKARTQLIDQLVSMGQIEDAISEYIRLAEVYYSLADRTNSRKTYVAALRLATQMNASKETRAKVMHRLADLDMQGLDWRQALRVYEQLKLIQPDDDKARSTLIDLNLRMNQTNQALTELDDYISYLFSVKRYDAALKFVEELVKENGKVAGIRRRMAELYRQAGRTDDAIEQLDAAGDMLMEAGDRTGAVEAIRAILALDPPNAEDYRRVLANLTR
jgi:tetratricopeptide (TPR) repeat protein